MSIVGDFASGAATQSFAMIGSETVTIGATSFSAVLAEAELSKDFSEGGFELIRRLSAVAKTADLPSGNIVKKKATARSSSWRVDSESRGATFTTLTLTEIEKA